MEVIPYKSLDLGHLLLSRADRQLSFKSLAIDNVECDVSLGGHGGSHVSVSEEGNRNRSLALCYYGFTLNYIGEVPSTLSFDDDNGMWCTPYQELKKIGVEKKQEVGSTWTLPYRNRGYPWA